MIPTKTLRERLTEALADFVSEGDYTRDPPLLPMAVQAAIDAIGDPVLIKTADSLEPTFTLRAQDRAASFVLSTWYMEAHDHGCPVEKLDEANLIGSAFLNWPKRKWPD